MTRTVRYPSKRYRRFMMWWIFLNCAVWTAIGSVNQGQWVVVAAVMSSPAGLLAIIALSLLNDRRRVPINWDLIKATRETEIHEHPHDAR
jgi:hypothetical protein